MCETTRAILKWFGLRALVGEPATHLMSIRVGTWELAEQIDATTQIRNTQSWGRERHAKRFNPLAAYSGEGASPDAGQHFHR